MPKPIQKRQRTRTNRTAEMAEFAGVTDQTMRDWLKIPGFPKAADGSVCLWDLCLWRDRAERGVVQPGDDDLLADVDSPALERYRMARAEQEEIKLLKMRGDYLPREDVHAALMETGSVMKAAGEQIIRAAGNDLADVFIAAWSEVMARLEKLFGDDLTGGEIDGAGGATQ